MQDFETFVFMGQLRFRCPHCEFDSHDRNQLMAHISGSHRTSQPLAMPTLFDAEGELITAERFQDVRLSEAEAADDLPMDLFVGDDGEDPEE